MKSGVAASLVFGALAMGGARATNIPTPNIPALAATADLILVGRVAQAEEFPQSQSSSHGVDITVYRVLKGALLGPRATISVPYDELGFSARVLPGVVGLYFLKASAEGQIAFAHESVPGVVAAPAMLLPRPSPIPGYDQTLVNVTNEIVNVLTLSLQIAGNPKAGVAADVRVIGTPVVDQTGHEVFWERAPTRQDVADTAFKDANDALATVPTTVRRAILDEVLRRRSADPGRIWAVGASVDAGDPRELGEVVRFLRDPSNANSLAEQTLFSDISSIQPTESELSLITSLMSVQNVYVRRAAARAIEQISKVGTTKIMLAFIDDPDSEVRYKAIQTVCDHLDGCGEHAYSDFSTVLGAAKLRAMAAGRPEPK